MVKNITALKTPDMTKPMTASLLGEAIKARRTQSKLRLSDAASLCGVSKQTFSDIEKGKGNSQLSTILQVCAGLGIIINIKPWQTEENFNND